MSNDYGTDRRDDLRLVPLAVGSPTSSAFGKAIEILSKYWKDDSTFFVISSDFCHWYVRLFL